MAVDESELTRQLYRTPPARFVAAREAAAAEARRAGDTAAARRLARSRRPTVAAWLVNLLALDRPELVAELGPLAEALRGAQRDLKGARLRELSGQRRALVAALVTEVRRLAADRPDAPPAARLPLAEVEATLHAALADPGVAGRVRAGRLLKAVHHSGFGEVPARSYAWSPAARRPPAAPRPPAAAGGRLPAVVGGRPVVGRRLSAYPGGGSTGVMPGGSATSGRRRGPSGPNGIDAVAPWCGSWRRPGPPSGRRNGSGTARRRPSGRVPTRSTGSSASWPTWSVVGPPPSRS